MNVTKEIVTIEDKTDNVHNDNRRGENKKGNEREAYKLTDIFFSFSTIINKNLHEKWGNKRKEVNDKMRQSR